jgi:hypothetical protein
MSPLDVGASPAGTSRLRSIPGSVAIQVTASWTLSGAGIAVAARVLSEAVSWEI